MVRGRLVRLDFVADLIETRRAGQRGPFYRVVFAGEEIIQSAVQASLDACRVLAGRGFGGWIGFRHADGMIGLVTKVEVGAKLTVVEAGNRYPRFAEWQPFTGSEYARIAAAAGLEQCS